MSAETKLKEFLKKLETEPENKSYSNDLLTVLKNNFTMSPGSMMVISRDKIKDMLNPKSKEVKK